MKAEPGPGPGAARDGSRPPGSGDLAVEVAGVEKAFGNHSVLRGVDLSVGRGEVVTVMGGSGSGKTVLLRLVAGLIKPDRGRLRLLSVDTVPLREEALLPLRRRTGFVFQGAALFDSLTVFENVAYPFREHARLSETELRGRVERLLGLVGLADAGPALPPDLSGGMRKRVGIARALALGPELMFYDEPTAGLDPTNARLITDLLLGLRAQGVSDTAMVVTHDLEFARAVSDRIAVLIGGRIAQAGPPETILHSEDPAVQAFLAGQAAA